MYYFIAGFTTFRVFSITLIKPHLRFTFSVSLAYVTDSQSMAPVRNSNRFQMLNHNIAQHSGGAVRNVINLCKKM